MCLCVCLHVVLLHMPPVLQMAKMLDVLEAFLNLHGHTYMRLDGSTKPEARQVGVPAAGGEGWCCGLGAVMGGLVRAAERRTVGVIKGAEVSCRFPIQTDQQLKWLVALSSLCISLRRALS